MRGVWAGCVMACIAATPTFGQPAEPPEGSVFQLLTLDTSQGQYREVEMGTAFFISADGTALTNSHVVYTASHDPRHYRLLALVGKEFYSVTVVCASSLEDPGKSEEVSPERDVALIKLTPSRFPFTQIGYTTSSGDEEFIATAHLRSLPKFAALALGDNPTPGDHIRVVGFGTTAFTTRAARWVAEGTVGSAGTAEDGTPVFRIEFLNRPGPGGSGSPVLDDANRVVGMYTWTKVSSSAFSAAIAGSAVAAPCP